MLTRNNILLLFGAFFLFVLWNLYLKRLGDVTDLSYKFDGVVEYVTYDEKGFPFIIVNKTEFYLYTFTR